MKRKIFALILSVIAVSFSVCLSSCGDSGKEDEEAVHNHSFERIVTWPTCTESGYTTYTCSCGYSFVDNINPYLDPVDHDYVDGKCKWCNKSKPEDYFLDGLGYFLSDDETYYICSGNGTDREIEGEIVIASECNGKPVKAIAKNAFHYCTFITSVTIPDSVESIGRYAFNGCSSLITVTIPDSVTVIEGSLFNFCKGVTVYCEAESKPDGWDDYWNGNNRENPRCPVVWDCKNNNVADNGRIYDEIDGLRYSLKDGKAVVTMQFKDKEGEITIPQSVTYKGITYNVTTIADKAFENCRNLTSIIIPNGLTSIGDSAFDGCYYLTEAQVPDSVTSIGSYAFAFCFRLASINIPNGIDKISEGTYRNCSSVTSITIPDTVKKIDKMAFHCIEGLTSVIIPDSVVTIGYNSFGFCENLQSITIGRGVKTIGDNVLDHCDNLKDINYNGTKDEWFSITKSDNWDKPMTRYTIQCTDGDIEINKEIEIL